MTYPRHSNILDWLWIENWYIQEETAHQNTYKKYNCSFYDLGMLANRIRPCVIISDMLRARLNI